MRKKEEKKNQLELNLLMDFLRSMRVHSEGLAGTRFIPVNVVGGELPLMLFSFPHGSKSMWVLSRPWRRTGGTSSSLLFPPRCCWTMDGTVWRRERETERQLGSVIPSVELTPTWANCGSNQGWKYCLLIGWAHAINKCGGGDIWVQIHT